MKGFLLVVKGAVPKRLGSATKRAKIALSDFLVVPKTSFLQAISIRIL